MQLNLIDIGARGGAGFPWRSNAGLIGTTLSFEPNDPPRIERAKINFPTAVWNFDGEAEFTVYGRRGYGSSLLKQNVDWVRENFATIRRQGSRMLNETWFDRAVPRGTFTCPVRRLDTVLAELPDRPRFHFLKSDTQSGEWFVVDGARDFLACECLGVELECFRYPLYAGLRTETEVIELMSDLGFDRWGWTGYQNSFLSQADYLFLRRDAAPADRPAVETLKRIYRTSGPYSLIKRRTVAYDVTTRVLARAQALVAARAHAATL